MAENRMQTKVLFRPTFAGGAVLLAPLVLFLPGGLRTAEPPVLIIGLGLWALLLLSAVFLFAALPGLLLSFRRTGASAETLPPFSLQGESRTLELDPPRPGFLPGVRLSAGWRLGFGGFRKNVMVPLVHRKVSSSSISFFRRGLWTGCYVHQASDPFGLFILRFRNPELRQTVVPPEEWTLTGNSFIGSPAHDSATAPRPKEDAEELLERRDYRPGDDIRRLDWKQLARTGDMLVRIGDDTVPFQGRVWVDVVATPSSRPHSSSRRPVRHLDTVLPAVAGLVRRLMESGQEAMVRLPGESEWHSADEEDWPIRLASALPARLPDQWPAAGERLWVISHPADDAGVLSSQMAREAGCRVSLAFPVLQVPGLSLRGFLFSSESRASSGFFNRSLYQLQLKRSVGRTGEAGIDVRSI